MGFLYVGLGGAIGAMLRYAVGLIPYKGTFPLITLVINVLGAFFIGFFTGIAEGKNLSDNTLLFLRTGLCGGFSTFAAFSLEAYNMFSSGSHILAVVYSLVSFILCITGVWLGILAGKAVVKG